MARKNKPKRYAGVLAEPMRSGDFEGLCTRIDALFSHYGLSRLQPGDGDKLVLELARDLVPGFAVFEPSPGAPVTFSAAEIIMIFADVKILLDAGTCSTVREACRNLACGQGYTGEQIRAAYKAFKTAFRDLARGKATFQQMIVLSIVWGARYETMGGDPREASSLLHEIRLAGKRNRGRKPEQET